MKNSGILYNNETYNSWSDLQEIESSLYKDIVDVFDENISKKIITTTYTSKNNKNIFVEVYVRNNGYFYVKESLNLEGKKKEKHTYFNSFASLSVYMRNRYENYKFALTEVVIDSTSNLSFYGSNLNMPLYRRQILSGLFSIKNLVL